MTALKQPLVWETKFYPFFFSFYESTRQCSDVPLYSMVYSDNTQRVFMQEELNELETMEPASTACQDVITSTEGKPDPLLPITSGPENSSWDRWFQRVRSSRSNKWWASRGSDFS